MRILIVDDEALNRKLLEDVLGARGHEVLIAENGQKAVEQARSEHPDLILLDLKMPVMDGYEALDLLKGEEETSGIPVWVVTASAMPDTLERIRHGKADECFTKPVDIVELTGRIDALEQHKDRS